MIYMFLAEGFEETEAIGTLDIIKRAGIEIKTVSISETENKVTGSHGISVIADIKKNEAELSDIDGVILPGGMPGTLNLKADETVQKFISYCYENKKMLAAICAAPMIYGEAGFLKGKKATCYPGFEKYLEGAEHTDDAVTVCDNFITGKGAGVSMLFGSEIVEYFIKGKGRELLLEVQY